jgi:ABC-type molybdate transport system substrate-binding protein
MGMPVGLKTEAAGFPAIMRKQNGLGTRIPLDALWTYVHHCQAVISTGIYFCGLVALAACGCKSRGVELSVFYASSPSAVLGDAVEAFRTENPQVRIRPEPSGSQVAARKVTELGMRADIGLVADAALIDKIMIPSHATWNAVFATNEIVSSSRLRTDLAYGVTVSV